MTGFIVFEFLLSYYVSNFTARERTSWEGYSPGGVITALDASYDDSLFAVGDAEGHLSLVQRSGLSVRWTYNDGSSIKTLKMSSSGDYVGWMDADGWVGLFSLTPPRGGKATPLWAYNMPGVRLEGVYSTGGLPPLVYLVVSEGDRLIVFDSDGAVVHQYLGVSDFVNSRLSYDGSMLASVDSEGRTSLYDLTSRAPIWVQTTGLRNASLAISMDGSVFVVGGSDAGSNGGAVCIIERNGTLSRRFSFDSAVRKVDVSSNGGRVYTLLTSGDVFIEDIDGSSLKTEWIIGGISEMILTSLQPIPSHSWRRDS